MHASRQDLQPAPDGPGGFRGELARALGLGELLVLAALVALAPVLRLEDAYVPVVRFPPHIVAGEGYFLWIVALLGALTAVRSALAGRLALPEPAAAAALGAWALYLAIRAAGCDHPFEARGQAAMWFGHLALFVVVLAAAAGKDGLGRVLFAALAAGLVLESVQVIWQGHVGLAEMRARILAGELPLAGEGFDSPVARSRLFSTEPTGSFLTSNILGAWLAMAGAAVAGLLAGSLAAGRWDGRTAGPGAVRTALLVAAAGLAAAATGWALALTGSKGAWLAAFGGMAATLFVAPPADAELRRRRLRLAGGAMLALALAAGLLYWARPGLPGGAGLAASLDVRLGYWRPAAEMAAERPALGVGPGTFGARFPKLKGPMAEEAQSAHCAWLETAAESGMVGLVLLAGFWALVLRRLWRNAGPEPALSPPSPAAGYDDAPARRREANLVLLAGAGAAFAFAWLRFGQADISQFLEALRQPPEAGGRLKAFLTIRALDFPLIWAAAFLLIARPALSPADPAAAGRWLRRGAAAGLAIFLLHSAVDMDMGMRAMTGSALILAALAMAAPGGGPLRRVLRLDGRRALAGAGLVAVLAAGSLWLGIGQYRRAGALADLDVPPPEEVAARPFDRAVWHVGRLRAAVAADPLDCPLRLMLARLCNVAANLAPDREQARALLAEAEAQVRRAAELTPARPTPRAVLGHLLLLDGRASEAADAFREAHELYPLKSELLLGWGDAELLAGRTDAARARYRDALAVSRRVADEAIHLSVLFEDPGLMTWQLPRMDAIVAALDAAIAREPGDGALLLRRALTEVARGRPEPALEWLRRAAGAEPKDALLLLFEGYGLRLAGRSEEALARMAEAGRLEGTAGALPAGPRAVGAAIGRTRASMAAAAAARDSARNGSGASGPPGRQGRTKEGLR
ncbi:MAG TPA: O-antigen ligase family protein [Planctomycetota bacterium]|nr:O-antigen ligase family protein [Planctomycetota bacterium]